MLFPNFTCQTGERNFVLVRRTFSGSDLSLLRYRATGDMDMSAEESPQRNTHLSEFRWHTHTHVLA